MAMDIEATLLGQNHFHIDLVETIGRCDNVVTTSFFGCHNVVN